MSTAENLAYQAHNHHRCIDTALQEARQLCAARGVQLTAQREDILRRVWQSHCPVGAYELLEQLPVGDSGRKPAPTTVYRALDFLQQQGLVHRLDSLNAYIGCPHPGHHHDSVFLVCTDCGRVQELPDRQVQQALDAALQAEAFRPRELRMEVLGQCPDCAGQTLAGQGA